MAVQSVTANDGSTVSWDDAVVIGEGMMKEVYFSPCKSYVVAFYKERPDAASMDRLKMLVGRYHESIFSDTAGDYWKNFFCWPDKIIEHQGRVGITVPAYQSMFFFEHGSVNDDMLNIKGKEKQGKWFASASNQNRFLDDREKGTWLNYLQVCMKIARGVRRLHSAGLAHSDLSYKNVLLSPTDAAAVIIDLDGLVVPGKYPPDVVGTPDFIAPEVIATAHLNKNDPGRNLPNMSTDRHALAVLIYHYLFLRHPLRGDLVHDIDPQIDEKMSMGEKALFIEHPENTSNRIKIDKIRAAELPWKNTEKLPYSIAGPYLKNLFDRAFIDGLHAPELRPTADEWEQGLVKTIDLIQPCVNSACAQQWYVFDNSTKPKCPFCGTPYNQPLPVLNFYSERGQGRYITDNHRLMVFSNQSLFPWHVNRLIHPNENISPEHKRRVGYFVYHNQKWYLVNEGMPALKDAASGTGFPIGAQIILEDGMSLLVGTNEGDRLIQVQMANMD